MDSVSSEIIITQNNEDIIFEDNLSIDFECDTSTISQSLDDIHSNGEEHSARLKFEEICESINEEEKRLQELEERRKKLELDMERLQEEIEQEKHLFRQAIDAEIAKKQDIDINTKEVASDKFIRQPKIDPLSINKEEVDSKIREYREAMQESKMQSSLYCENDEEMKRLKFNLATYKKAIEDTKKDNVVKQKRKAAAKMFQKHLDEVDLKCTEQIGKLATIQKSIEDINVAHETGSHLPKGE